VVLLHGWPCFWYDWRHVIPRLRDRHDVVAVDLRGFGDSSAPDGDPTIAYDESRLAADVLALMDALGIQRCALAGHDIGSAVAPAAARRAPDRVTALALFNPTHPHIGARRYTPEMQRELWHHAFHALPWSHRLIARDRETVVIYIRHFLEHWTGRADGLVAEEADAVIDTFARPGAVASSLGWYRSREASRRRREGAPPPPPLRCPTFVGWGDADPVSPLAWRRGLERAYPHVKVRVLAGVGHFVPIEAPDPAADLIAAAAAAAADCVRVVDHAARTSRRPTPDPPQPLDRGER
jgi:pimeloyl-ACP methyl ester carboxylesterase